MILTTSYLKEKAVINVKIGNRTFYRLVLSDPPGKILDIVRKGRFYYKYTGKYDLVNTPTRLMTDLELIRDFGKV